jgi:hypothetical protein
MAMNVLEARRTLGLEAGAREDEVRAAFQRLALKHHPDQTGSDATRMRLLVDARATLLKEIAKKRGVSLQEILDRVVTPSLGNNPKAAESLARLINADPDAPIHVTRSRR